MPDGLVMRMVCGLGWATAFSVLFRDDGEDEVGGGVGGGDDFDDGWGQVVGVKW